MTSTTKVSYANDDCELSDKSILIVDDEQLIARTVETFLRKGGVTEIRYETDSRLAMKVIGEYEPDLVLLDISMPHVCGLELLEQITSDSDFDNVIVMMLSSAGQDERNRSLEMGAAGFIRKPANEKELVQAVSTAFRMANRFGTR
jgi:two-component system chemotaxis response regulator CheY